MAQSIWRNVFGGKRDTTVESLCAAGLHQVDPNWLRQGKPCPYCRAAGDTSRSQGAPAVSAPSNAPSNQRAPTRPEEGGAAASTGPAMASQSAPPRNERGRTVVDGGTTAGPSAAPSPDHHFGGGRRIQAVLTTYTWSGAGELFVLRDGRNYVGSGNVATENNAPCEVLISNDKRLSSAHFLILYQAGRPLISDLLSLNGTVVDGKPIDGSGVELHDNAVIKAGDTVFTFQRIKRPDAVAGAHPPSVNPPPISPAPPPDAPPSRKNTLIE